MRHSPIPAIQTQILERIGHANKVPMRQRNFRLEFDYYIAGHPKSPSFRLVCEVYWNKQEDEVYLAVHQPGIVFPARHDQQSLDFFFGTLSEALRPDLKAFVPEWGNYAACVMVFKPWKDAPERHPGYLSCVECHEYELDEVAKLATESFNASLFALTHSQSAIEAIAKGEHALNLAEHIERMKRVVAEQEALVAK